MITILFAAPDHNWHEFEAPLRANLQGLDFELTRAPQDPAAVDYIIYAPSGPINDFTPYSNARAVLSLWAGVETIVTNNTITVPLARMVEPGLSQGMAEYVTGHALRYHLMMPVYAQDGVWRDKTVPPIASARTVGFLGIGALGQAAAAMCRAVGFQTIGWSRSPKSIPDLPSHHGETGLQELLAASDILVTLLPLTEGHNSYLKRKITGPFAQRCRDHHPGRGPLIDDTALLAALDDGHIAGATLDVFATEPLPSSHPYWSHEKVFVTPHIAASTRAETGAQAISENIRRDQNGEPLLNLVDRAAGY